jgi:putative Mg2+ transporter-C (MgtC) family protein
MQSDVIAIPLHLIVAMVAGGLIGLERSYSGRPAGLRTHTLVCMASSLLMLVSVYQRDWLSAGILEKTPVDPTRMAQGIMTGIGFLGAGVIMKDKLSVRGLTTAASIWITAAIGILSGMGFYHAVALVTLLTLGTLSLYRMAEGRIPTLTYFHHSVRFLKDTAMTEAQIRDLVSGYGFTIASMGYTLTHEGKYFEYDMMLGTRSPERMDGLCQALAKQASVIEFRITPAGELHTRQQ